MCRSMIENRRPKNLPLGLALQTLMILVSSPGIFAQAADPSDSYFPLQVGNRWVMEAYNSPAPNFVVSYAITDTINRAGKIYFAFRANPNYARYLREDSSRNIYEYSPATGEFLLFDFSMPLGDSIKYGNPPRSAVVLLSRSATVNTRAGIFSDCLYFMYDRFIPAVDDEEYYYFAKNVGLVRYYPVWDTPEYLLGAYVNGRLIGDTTTVGVDDQRTAIANGYALSQNFPNPFLSVANSRLMGNAFTTIRFAIPQPAAVKIQIFDNGGRLIKSLVDASFTPGEYSVQWDGKDEIGHEAPSGVYFARLAARETVMVKKLIFLK